MKCGRDLLRQARGGNHEDVGSTSRNRRRRAGERRRLAQAIGRDVSRFQEASYTFDDVAAEILALNRSDLPIMTMLLFGGPASADELAAVLHVRRPLVSATLERLRLAGYARFQPGAGPRIELTGHARKWIERIWAALRQEGLRLIDRCSTPDLAVIAAFLRQACAVQESAYCQIARLARAAVVARAPLPPARRPVARGAAARTGVHRGESRRADPPARSRSACRAQSLITSRERSRRPPARRHGRLSSVAASSLRSVCSRNRGNRSRASPWTPDSARRAG